MAWSAATCSRSTCSVEQGAHALLTTPGATRFYRSAGERRCSRRACGSTSGARLEWLPLEAIAYAGCIGENRVQFDLAPGAEMIGWDVLALGLPAADEPFMRGSFVQQLQWPGVWLERGRMDAADRRLFDSPLGLDGQSVLATLWFASRNADVGRAARCAARCGAF